MDFKDNYPYLNKVLYNSMDFYAMGITWSNLKYIKEEGFLRSVRTNNDDVLVPRAEVIRYLESAPDQKWG